jgi:endonuclease YncB( thermonuclease family)
MKSRLKILLFFICFSCCNAIFAGSENAYKIIKVVDTDTFYADFNNDGIPQPDEKIRIPGADGSETKYSKQFDSH